jgi:hypothetical protein
LKRHYQNGTPRKTRLSLQTRKIIGNAINQSMIQYFGFIAQTGGDLKVKLLYWYNKQIHISNEKRRMEKLIVKVVKLEPMRVAYTHAISKTPETDAWNALVAWA